MVRAVLPLVALVALSVLSPTATALGASRIEGEIDAAGLRDVLSREKGRIVLVNFWATWCVPCREEFPDLSRLQKNLEPQGLRVIGISTDFASQTAAVERFLSQMRPSFVNYRKKGGGDDQQFIDAVDRSWGGELPFSVLYARDGRKARVLSGRHSYADYEREVRSLLSR